MQLWLQAVVMATLYTYDVGPYKFPIVPPFEPLPILAVIVRDYSNYNRLITAIYNMVIQCIYV